MSPRDAQFGGKGSASICAVAARWVVRRDRGLSETEEAEFARWLRADPRHAEAFDYFSASWNVFEGCPAPATYPQANDIRRISVWQWIGLGGVAAASACALLYLGTGYLGGNGRQRYPQRELDQITAVDTPRTKMFSDGSFARLNTATVIREQFTSEERRIALVRGEAYFTVTKDPGRPFVVYVGDIAIHAVGTAFNVNLKAHAIEVLVTEGKVRVATARGDQVRPHSATESTEAMELRVSAPLVAAGQRAIVTTGSSTSRDVVVAEAQPAEIARALAWCEPLMTLGGATLAEVCAEFGRQTGKRLVLRDPALGELRMGGRFPMNDDEGFVRALEENFGIKAERRMDGTVILDRAP
ncbi:MAG: FecR domain-containing protein [Opitutaceae bacterium]|nr:FecR domain-containing protein [Opitutaceae bacterium]